MSKPYACPGCGARKGEPHGRKCTRVKPQQPCPPHEPQTTGKPDANGKYRYRCSKCKEMLGRW